MNFAPDKESIDRTYNEGFDEGQACGVTMGRVHEQVRVERFHTDVVGLHLVVTPRMDPAECMRRARLIAEEAAETVAALIGGNAAMTLGVEMAHKVQGRSPSLVEYCDGAADLRVVLHGTDLMLGVWSVANQVFDHVMDTNDAKKDGPKDPVTQKQLKPPGWVPPDIAGILRRELGWEE